MSLFLLDVNVLLALVDPRHVDHERAHVWFHSTGSKGWTTCATTENGFIRIASNPRYPNCPGNVHFVRALLSRFCQHAHHAYWTEGVTLRDEARFAFDGSVSCAHVTDLYLVGLAAENRGKLATFDRRIPASAVKGGDDILEVIAQN